MNFKLEVSNPVLVLAYNRPKLTLNLLRKLNSLDLKKLYIYVDGPKSNDDVYLNEEVKRIVDEFNPSYSTVKNYRSINFGCGKGVSTAVSETLNIEETVIVLEDDLDPSHDFFRFCDYNLDAFRFNDKMLSISGNSFFDMGDQPILSKYPHVWGWATWKKSWTRYDVNIFDWSKTNYPDWFLNYPFTNNAIRELWEHNFNNIVEKRIDTWDYQLTYCAFKYNLLNIHPPVNLVNNLGFSKNATHTLTKISKPMFNNRKLNYLDFGNIPKISSYDELWERHLLLIFNRKIEFIFFKLKSLLSFYAFLRFFK